MKTPSRVTVGEKPTKTLWDPDFRPAPGYSVMRCQGNTPLGQCLGTHLQYKHCQADKAHLRQDGSRYSGGDGQFFRLVEHCAGCLPSSSSFNEWKNKDLMLADVRNNLLPNQVMRNQRKRHAESMLRDEPPFAGRGIEFITKAIASTATKNSIKKMSHFTVASKASQIPPWQDVLRGNDRRSI